MSNTQTSRASSELFENYNKNRAGDGFEEIHGVDELTEFIEFPSPALLEG